jgi:hypothetical protein
MRREGNILSRILRDGWDHGDLAMLTKNSPAKATGAHISICTLGMRFSRQSRPRETLLGPR